MRSLAKVLTVVILLLVASMLLTTGKFYRPPAEEEVTMKSTDTEEELTVLRDEMKGDDLPVLDGIRKVVVLEKNKPKANPAAAADNVRELSPIVPTKKLQEPLQLPTHSWIPPQPHCLGML